MRKLIILSVILLCSIQTHSYIITDQSKETIKSINPPPSETIIIDAGDTVQITDNWHAHEDEITCQGIYVREGGVLEWTGGARANLGALWLGGMSSPPFSSEGGGRMYMGPNDTLGLINTNQFGGADLYFQGPECGVYINGQSSDSKAVVMGRSSAPGTYILGNQSDGIFEAEYCKFIRLFDAGYSGLYLGVHNQRDNNQQKIENCIFDSSGIRMAVVGEKLLNDTFYTYIGMPPSIYLSREGKQCSLWNCSVIENNEFLNVESNVTLVAVSMDSVLIYGTSVKSINVTGQDGASGKYGISVFNAENLVMRLDTVDTFVWGVVINNTHDVLIDSCVIMNCTHEGILHVEGGSDSAWTVQSSVFYNNGYMDFLWNEDMSRNLDLKILYNTFASYHPTDGGMEALAIRNHGGPGDLALEGVTVVGNICIGRVRDVSLLGDGVPIVITFDDFKHNAFDFMYLGDGSQAFIKNGAYDIADSNLTDQDQYGFADSTIYDLRLANGSPMLNAGDSAYWAQVFAPGGSNADPGNIGYYQGPGVGGTTRFDIDREIYEFLQGTATLQDVLDLIEKYINGE